MWISFDFRLLLNFLSTISNNSKVQILPKTSSICTLFYLFY